MYMPLPLARNLLIVPWHRLDHGSPSNRESSVLFPTQSRPWKLHRDCQGYSSGVWCRQVEIYSLVYLESLGPTWTKKRRQVQEVSMVKFWEE